MTMVRGFLVLLIASGCWQPAAVAVEPTPSNVVTIEAPNATTPIVTRKPRSPYAEVAGTWKGIGFQYDTKGSWDIEMTLQNHGEIDDVIGTIAYEQGGCTANLIRKFEDGEHGEILVMQEKLVTGQGRCVDNGRIRIPRRPTANELDWRWDFSPGREGASSTVKRE